MSYDNLKDVYYKNDKVGYEKEYQQRFNSIATEQLPLFIKSKHENMHQLFFITVPEILELIENINDKINQRPFLSGNEAPNAFLQDYIMKLMLSEIKTTNEIEGVFTKKEDLEHALQNFDDATIRFHFIIKKYNKLIANEKIPLKVANDIRVIYDELLKNEIETNDLPDGNLFRKGPVSVFRRSGKSKEIHQGLYPEESIINAVNNLLLFINSSKCSFYIKVAVVHYYLGYIHPFYDGNGRLSRFISTALIFEKKDELLALKLSKKIKDNIKAYDQMFDLTNSEYNKGDMTPFILMFLNVLSQACDEINYEMEIYTSKLNNINMFLSYDTNLENEVDRSAVFLIYQSDMLDIKINVKEIADYISKSVETTRKIIKALEQKEYIQRGEKGDSYNIYLTEKLKNMIRDFFYDR